MSSKRRRKKARVPGLIITIILLLLVAEFVGLLAITKLLPVYLLFAVGIVFMTCVLLVAMLTGNFRKKVRFIIGAILGVLLLVILLLGNLYVMSTYNTLNKISGVNTQTSQIGVYVLKNDSAQSIADAKSYTFGQRGQRCFAAGEKAVRRRGAAGYGSTGHRCGQLQRVGGCGHYSVRDPVPTRSTAGMIRHSGRNLNLNYRRDKNAER